MAIQIVGVEPVTNTFSADAVADHLKMVDFVWIDEVSSRRGVSPRDVMYDWIVNNQGKAFVKKANGERAYVFGAISSDGKKYIRTAENKIWTNELMELQRQATVPPPVN